MAGDTLFDLEPTLAKPETPRCRMCARPAWRNARGEVTAYCGSNACQSRQRLCQICEAPFSVGINGAGTKYCSTECKDDGYNPTRASRPACAWCGKHSPAAHRGSVWPYICQDCIEPIKHIVDRLKDHHVPHERARLLLTERGCEICGSDIVAKMRLPGRSTRMTALLVVDHDHRCCPADAKSCGRCVRGLICHNCNIAAGMVANDPQRARNLASYLDRTSPVFP